MRLVGFHGYKGSGKDTAASTLVRDLGYTPIAFAEPMRAMLSMMLSYVGMDAVEAASWFDDRDKKEQPIPAIGASYRHLAVTLGTEWGRDLIRPDLWVLIAKTRIERLMADGANVVVTDVRFEDEAKMIRDLGGEIWLIDRPSVSQQSEHRSEQRISGSMIDRTVLNDGDRDALREMIHRIHWIACRASHRRRCVQLALDAIAYLESKAA